MILGSANYQVLGDFAQAACSFAVGSKLRDGLAGEIIRDFVGTLQSVNRGIGGFLLGDIFSRSLAQRGRRFFHVQNVVGDLKGPADSFAEAAQARDVVGARAGAERAGGDRSANQRGGLRAVYVFEHFRLDAPALGLQVGDLAADHAVDGARGAGDFSYHGDALGWRDGCCADGFERESQQRVSGQDGYGFAKFFVASRFAAAEVVVVESGQVVVDQGIGVDHFDGASGMQRGGNVGHEDSRRLEAQNRADALASGKNAVAHGLMDGSWARGFAREKTLEGGVDGQAVFFKEGGELHRGGSGMGHESRARLKLRSLFLTPFPARRARPRVFRRLSSAESRRVLRPLRAASGTRGTGLRLPRIVSWLRPARAGGFRGGEPLLPSALGTSRSRASSAAPVFLQALSSRDK